MNKPETDTGPLVAVVDSAHHRGAVLVAALVAAIMVAAAVESAHSGAVLLVAILVAIVVARAAKSWLQQLKFVGLIT